MDLLCIDKQVMKKEKLTILLIEDSKIIRGRLSSLLKELRNVNQVLEAGSYEEAMEVLLWQMVDVVVLDIGLPGKSGVDILRSLQERQWKPTVIVLTNQADDYLKNLCLSLGATHFLDKSKDFDMIADIVTSS